MIRVSNIIFLKDATKSKDWIRFCDKRIRMHQITRLWNMIYRHHVANKAVEIERPHEQDLQNTNEQSTR